MMVSPPQTINITVPNAGILSLPTLAVQLVPVQGAGQVIMLQWVAIYSYLETAHGNFLTPSAPNSLASALFVEYASGQRASNPVDSDSLLDVVGESFTRLNAVDLSETLALFSNQPLQLRAVNIEDADTENFDGGEVSNFLRVVGRYEVVDLSQDIVR